MQILRQVCDPCDRRMRTFKGEGLQNLKGTLLRCYSPVIERKQAAPPRVISARLAQETVQVELSSVLVVRNASTSSFSHGTPPRVARVASLAVCSAGEASRKARKHFRPLPVVGSAARMVNMARRVHHAPPTTHHSTHYLLLTAHHSPLTTYYSLHTTYHLPLTTYYSLLTAHHSLLTTSGSSSNGRLQAIRLYDRTSD